MINARQFIMKNSFFCNNGQFLSLVG